MIERNLALTHQGPRDMYVVRNDGPKYVICRRCWIGYWNFILWF